MRGAALGGVQAEAWAWARIAMAEELVQQSGFDETQVDGKCPIKCPPVRQIPANMTES